MAFAVLNEKVTICHKNFVKKRGPLIFGKKSFLFVFWLKASAYQSTQEVVGFSHWCLHFFFFKFQPSNCLHIPFCALLEGFKYTTYNVKATTPTTINDSAIEFSGKQYFSSSSQKAYRPSVLCGPSYNQSTHSPLDVP